MTAVKVGARRTRARTRVKSGPIVLLVPLLFLSACFAVGFPPEGKPVAVGRGKALVFGRIRVTSPDYGGRFVPFSKDPMEHMLPPDPAFTLELRKVHAPGGAVRYSSFPAPEVEGDGSFYWILPEGEYALASNPRPYGSSRFDPDETAVLARFAVPPGAAAVYGGTLTIDIRIGQQELIDSWKGRETLYSISRVTAVDERDQALEALRKRYPSVPGPLETVLMTPGTE